MMISCRMITYMHSYRFLVFIERCTIEDTVASSVEILNTWIRVWVEDDAWIVDLRESEYSGTVDGKGG